MATLPLWIVHCPTGPFTNSCIESPLQVLGGFGLGDGHTNLFVVMLPTCCSVSSDILFEGLALLVNDFDSFLLQTRRGGKQKKNESKKKDAAKS